MITTQEATSLTQVVDQATNKAAFESRKAVDPNELDFEQLMDDYVSDYNIKIPFVKSTFIHGAFLPTQIQFGAEKPEHELVLTMEMVQAPHHVKINQLVDPNHEQNMKLKKLQASRKSMDPGEGRIEADAAINENSEDEENDPKSDTEKIDPESDNEYESGQSSAN